MAARPLPALADRAVTELHGVGEQKRAGLEAVGVTSVLDLLTYYPRRYVDRTQQLAIRDLEIGADAMVVAAVKRVEAPPPSRGRRLPVSVTITDGAADLRVSFFNQPWRAKQLKPGLTAAFFGKVDTFRGRKQMTNPVVDLIGDRTGRIIPIYPQSEKAGLTTWEVARWVSEALDRAGELADPVPDRWRRELSLIDRTTAFRRIHEPETMEDRHVARHRLAFDELLRMQLALVQRKRAIERESKGILHVVDGELTKRLEESLPFPLTGAQQRAIHEILDDLGGPHPMHRLLQGDVGAGKTLVAVMALLVAVQGVHQGAFMAPTEVLAEQHHAGVSSLLSTLTVRDDATLLGERPLRVELLTSRTPAAERTRVLDALRTGSVDILVGTHALLTEGVDFRSLGVVVIDEQHRFGVEQRAALRGKGDDPDVLVMTATPIPRTAAMTVYGDLDVTVLDELPPGRTPVRTEWAQGPLGEERAWQVVRDQVAEGRQAYVVCPLVDESERVEARSATEEHDRLAAEVLPELRLGLLHGRMKPAEKDQVMDAFRRRDVDVLVATTVIEVGVDVPNATVMVIEDADRFGLAQLHQLRGRVGRGAHESWCFLLGEGSTPDGEERLRAMERTSDGFELAEVDLELRGEGEILGARQKGRNDLKLASLRHDRELVVRAREVAFDIVDSDPMLEANPLLAAEVRAFLDESDTEFLTKS